MALDYTFIKYQDVYTLSNLDVVSTLEYTITLKNCDSSKIVNTGVVKPGESKIITFVMDGIYSISVTDGFTTEIIPDILNYEKLLNRIISGTEKVMCGCKPCSDCEDCNQCDDYLDLLAYVSVYPILFKPLYDNFIDNIQGELKCSFNETIVCLMNQGFIRGKVDIKELVLKLIASYYLAFYYTDLARATDLLEAEYIKTKYKSLKILKCLQKLGILFPEDSAIIQEEIDVFYWQFEDDILSDIDDVIPNNVYLDGIPSKPIEVFEEGFIVTYTHVGRVIFAIKETIISNFNIYDALGNDVTDEFDSVYYSTELTMIFVSKIAYAHSSTFYKFKKTIYV